MNADWRANVRRVYAWKALSNLHLFAGVLIPFFTDWGGITLSQMSSVGMTRQLLMATAYPLVGWAAQRSLSWTFAGLGAAILASAAASSVEEAHLLEQ